MVKTGDTWDRAVEFIGDHIAFILPIAIFALVIPSSISASLQPLSSTGPSPLRTALSVLGLVFAVLSLWAQLAIATMAIDPGQARRATGIATARLLPALAIYLLLIGAAFVVIVAQAAAIGAATGINLGATNWTDPMAIQSAAGSRGWLLLVVTVDTIVLVALMAKLAPLTGVIAVERRGIGAIARAWQLTRGLMWRLIGVILLYAVVASIAQLAARFAFGAIMRLISDGEGAVTVGSVVTSVVVSSVGAAFTVLAAAFCAKLYAATARLHDAHRMTAAELSPEPLT